MKTTAASDTESKWSNYTHTLTLGWRRRVFLYFFFFLFFIIIIIVIIIAIAIIS